MTDPEWAGKTVLAAWLVVADVAGGSMYVRLHAKTENGRVVLYSGRVKDGQANCLTTLYVIYRN